MATATQPHYIPGEPTGVDPKNGEQILTFLRRELRNIAQALTEVTFWSMTVIDAAPPKPRVGMIVFADGTNWNPGSGAGLYVYKSGGWTFVA